MFALVIVKAGGCGGCSRFVETGNQARLEEEAKKIPNLIVIHLTFPSTSAPSPSGHPAAFNRIVRTFPSFFLFDIGNETWGPGVSSAALSTGKSFNNTFNGIDRPVTPAMSRKDVTADNILEWVRNNVKSGATASRSSAPMASTSRSSAPMASTSGASTSGTSASRSSAPTTYAPLPGPAYNKPNRVASASVKLYK